MRTSIQKTIQMKTTIRSILITFTLLSLGLVSITQAVSPAPDGDYPGGNTAEGYNALFSLSPADGGFNTAIGWASLFANATGSVNTALGAGALALNTSHNNTATGAAALLLNTTGDANTATGAFALVRNTIGRANTAVGAGALALNDGNPSMTDSGSGNTAVGAGVLSVNITGKGSTGVGARALLNNVEDGSTAVGVDALTANTNGKGNTAVGALALKSNTTGAGNTAVGAEALLSNTTVSEEEIGKLNTAVGLNALKRNTTGSFNTAAGAGTTAPAPSPGSSPSPQPAGNAPLGKNTTGSFNTAVGAVGGLSDAPLGNNTEGTGNTAIGVNALDENVTGNSNIALGLDAGRNLTTGDSNIYIGNNGPSPCPSPSPTREDNTIRIGTSGIQTATYIAGIYTNPMIGTAVVVNSNGQLGAATSSARFKTDIESMDKSSEAIFALRPVSFHYKQEIDPKCQAQFGLVAEEVEKVNPALVLRDREGKPYTVRYDAVNAMLLNEFLKEHNTVQDLKKEIAALTATVKEQDARLQRVSAQLATASPSLADLKLANSP